MKSLFTCFILLLSAQYLQAQNVGIGTSNPNSSAVLEISSPNKGLLLPRVADTSSVPSPAKGLVIYSNNNNKLWYYNGSRWQQNVSNAGGMDSIWYKTRDSIVYTEKNYVAVNVDHDLMDPQANLQVNGSLLIQGKLDYSVAAPTVAQAYTMTNTPAIQNIPSSDSVFRLYDPGGTGNYNNNMQGNMSILSAVYQEGTKLVSVAADFGLGTGDTLWISNAYFPGCRTNYLFRYTSASTNPADMILPDYFNLIFRSNSDGNNGKGFNFIFTRLFHKDDYSKKIQTAGPALWFNALDGSFGAGTNCVTKFGGIAMGHNAISNGGIAIGNGSETVAGSLAIGTNAYAYGNGSVAIKGYAYGDNSFAIGGHSYGDNAVAILGGTTYGDHSFAISGTTDGSYSFTQGQYSYTGGQSAVALGYSCGANADFSFAAGYYSAANGIYSSALGYSSEANGSYSIAIGTGLDSRGYSGTVVGMYNNPLQLLAQTSVTGATPLFIVGNGDNSSTKSNAMVVLKNGNVGIGLTNTYPDDRLHVSGGNMLLDNTSNTTIELQAAGVDKAFLQLSGNNFRVGTNSSNATANFIVRTNGADQLTIFPSGNATLAGILTQNSDARFKERISTIPNALDKIMRLGGYQYYWKPELKKDNGLQIGLIAQNVESVLPELVITAENGMKSVAYQNMVPVLIEAMKEQQRLIGSQEDRIAALEILVKELKNKK